MLHDWLRAVVGPRGNFEIFGRDSRLEDMYSIWMFLKKEVAREDPKRWKVPAKTAAASCFM